MTVWNIAGYYAIQQHDRSLIFTQYTLFLNVLGSKFKELHH